MSDTAWRDGVYAALRESGAEVLCYLPDGGLDSFIRRAAEDPGVIPVALTTEEEGVGICCGAWLGGRKAALLIQSSGVGNCINAFSLVANCAFPFFLLVSMRGEFGETNPWQVPMGRTTRQSLELAGFHVHRATSAEEAVDFTRAGLQMAWRGGQPVAVLLSQRLLGAKSL